MKNILEELWYGNIIPMEHMFSGAGYHAQKPEFKRGINPVIK